jgi:hypothetical protein
MAFNFAPISQILRTVIFRDKLGNVSLHFVNRNPNKVLFPLEQSSPIKADSFSASE